jgi:hypothetical protein
VIRGLSVGIPIARTVRRELITGALVGVASTLDAEEPVSSIDL